MEKLLVTSNFSLSHRVFKRIVLQTHVNTRACLGKGLFILFVWCLMLFSTIFQLYCGGQYINSCYPGILFTNSFNNILSKPLAAFPHKHRRNNGQRLEKNESCHNDYHQSSVRILAEPGIEPTTSCFRPKRY